MAAIHFRQDSSSSVQPGLEKLAPFRQDPMLQYLSVEEWKGVAEAWDHPQLWNIALEICEGNWDSLFRKRALEFAKPRLLSYIMIAAYCQDQMAKTDLATAMLFHRVFANFKSEDMVIARLDETMSAMPTLEERRMYEALRRCDLDQRCSILVKTSALDPYTKRLCEKNFIPREFDRVSIGGVDVYQGFFRVCSVEICQKLYTTLNPVIHLTPTREEMERHIRQNRSDAALFFPDEESVVHGSRDQGVFSFAHDLFHTAYREGNGKRQIDMMEWAARFKIDQSFEKKMAPVLDSILTEFKEVPTEEECANWVIDEIRNAILDGFIESVETLLAELEEKHSVLALVLARTVFPKEMEEVETFKAGVIALVQRKLRDQKIKP